MHARQLSYLIGKAAAYRVSQLGLSGAGLRSLPATIRWLARLETLDLSRNRIDGFPAEMKELVGLRHLNLADNELNSLPRGLARLPSLVRLDLSGNRFANLPGWLEKLSGLEILSLSRNRLSEISPAIDRLGRLRELSLNDNQLFALPREISALARLRVLRLAKNQFETLSLDVGSLQLRVLDLSDNRLQAFPAEKGHFEQLLDLDLRNNKLTTLPAEFAAMVQLESLDLSHNELVSLPAEIGCLTRLKKLDLSNNRLRELPAELGQLRCLETLVLSRNALAALPRQLAGLKALRQVDISENRLSRVPAAVLKLAGCRELNLRSNQVTAIPDAVGNLRNLEILDVDGNPVASLAPGIGRCRAVRELRLADCCLQTLPPEIGELSALRALDLTGNRLKSLPFQLANARALKTLQLDGNPLVDPSPELVERGTKAVLAYLRESLEASSRQWVSKLILVGEGGVGKTCLLRALKGETFDPQSETTHGIEIHGLEFPHPSEEGVTLQLNTWDFGGQEIYHATHQFFLTRRSLFLLVWNARVGYPESRVYSWLERIRALAPDSPILLVATHIDERDADLPIGDLRRKFENIVGHWAISSKNGSGIEELRERIRHQAAELPLMGESWPASWLAAAEEIRSRPEEYISAPELDRIMIRHGVAPDSRAVLTTWLHDLGDLLYFADDEELEETVFLDPQWVTRHISSVLEYEEIIEGLGVFRHAHMKEVWRTLDRGLWELFLRLMERFDLSYRIPDDPANKSLIVERLALDRAPYEERWDAILEVEGCREITMTFDLQSTLPPGIPTWFIARSHRFTTNIHWRYGALLAEVPSGRHLALVEAPANGRHVTLQVRGPSPLNFFALLRDGLELTLRRFPGLEIKRTLPCPGRDGDQPCEHAFDHAHLKKRIERQPPILKIECPVCMEYVEIPALLYGIHWLTWPTVLERIDMLDRAGAERHDEILGHQDRVASELAALRELTQREFTHAFHRDQGLAETHTPSVFTLRPADRAGSRLQWTSGERWELQLFCEAAGCWHPATEGGLYEIEEPARWLTALAPHLRRLIKVLKFAAPLVGPWLATTEVGSDVDLTQDVALMQALAGKLPDIEADEGDRLAEGADALRVSDASLRGLRRLLDELDPAQHWGGLRKVCTPEGHYLWLCSYHAAELAGQKSL